MDTQGKIKQLRNIINCQLLPLITDDYILLDLPYHQNIGDTLIWEGEECFLKQTTHRCLCRTGWSFDFRELEEQTLILLHGGGNMGDLYLKHEEFRKKVISRYPKNKIIIFPQTVYYENQEYLKKDIGFYSQYENVTICAREKTSYNLLKQNFPNNTILLVPDMAFFIDVDKYKNKKGTKTLFLKRSDKELDMGQVLSSIPSNAEVHDWPTYEPSLWLRLLKFLDCNVRRLIRKVSNRLVVNRFEDKIRFNFYRPFYIRLGCRFLSKYKTVYTTRLHVMILGFLLEKQLFLIDNTSGKVLGFYDTWLRDIDSIKTAK